MTTALLSSVRPAIRLGLRENLPQFVTGALSDRIGREWLIATGMWVQSIGIIVVTLSSRFAGFATGGVLLGVGTAMVYPRCSPRSATWRSLRGAFRQSASIGCGETSATPWARCWRAWRRMC